MKPITRKEYYLAKAAGTYTGPTPPPVLREDYYLATLAGDYSGNCPAPVTRLEKYMSAAAGLTSYVPQPVTRVEKYWYAIAKGAGYVPEPVTREERFLYALVPNKPEPPKPEYVDKTAEGSLILLTDSAQAPLTALAVYGHSTQSGTPSPENLVPIVSAGSVMTTGANLWKYPEQNTLNGVTLTFEDGWGVLNGTCTSSSNFILRGQRLQEGEYTLSKNAQGNFPQVSAACIQIYSSSTGQQLAVPNQSADFVTGNITQEASDFEFRIRIDAGFEYNNAKIRPMLNAGSTALPWEPYTGGVPGVNPYEGEINVTVQGGNLVDESQIELGGLDGNTGNETGLTVRIRTGFIPVTGGQRYTISGYIPLAIANSHVFTSDKSTRLGSFSYNSELPLNAAFVRFSFSKSDQSDLTEEELEALKNTLVFNAGSTALPYMPYKTPQTLTAQTPGGLPGIPVDSGGNYTDENGQQWVCDEKDYKRGKYVQRVKQVLILSEWLADGNSQSDFTETFNAYTAFNSPSDMMKQQAPICNVLEGKIYNLQDLPSCSVGGSYNIYLRFPRTICGNTLTEIKSWVDENAVVVVYILETPIETDLPAEEIAPYKALHTYSPTTTVSNDAGAWMKVGYKAAL